MRPMRTVRTSRRLPVALALAGLAATLALAGCQSATPGPEGGAGVSAPGSGEMAPMPAPMPAPMGGPMGVDGAAADKAAAVAGQDRSIVRTAFLTVRVDDVDAAAAELVRRATAAGGELVGQDTSTGDGGPFATVTVKVPADALDAFLTDAEAVGTVVNASVSASDVTVQVVDLDARIAALQASVDRLLALLDEATQVADVVAIEAELGTRQAELDGLLAQQRALEGMVAMSSVTISLIPTAASAGAPAPGFLPGLEGGWNALRSVASWLTTVVGFALPFLVVAGVIAAVIAVPTRALVRRRRRARADADLAGE